MIVKREMLKCENIIWDLDHHRPLYSDLAQHRKKSLGPHHSTHIPETSKYQNSVRNHQEPTTLFALLHQQRNSIFCNNDNTNNLQTNLQTWDSNHEVGTQGKPEREYFGDMYDDHSGRGESCMLSVWSIWFGQSHNESGTYKQTHKRSVKQALEHTLKQTLQAKSRVWKAESLGWRWRNLKKSGQTRASRVLGNSVPFTSSGFNPCIWSAWTWRMINARTTYKTKVPTKGMQWTNSE